jgi:hypothetical protein
MVGMEINFMDVVEAATATQTTDSRTVIVQWGTGSDRIYSN